MLLFAPIARADPRDAVVQSDAPETTSVLQGQDIVVTAQRREQRINDTPISITALGGAAVRERQINSSADLVGIVPNFSATNPGTSLQFNIRGQALVDVSDVNESPVAIYQDNVYIASTAAQGGQIFDIDRIEVLRGPQGTLFGRNATAGLVHFITRKPTKELSGFASVQYGSFNQVIAEGAVSGEITPGIRGRLSGRYNVDDGYQRNLGSGGGRFGVTDVFSLRGQFEIDLSPDAKLNLRGYGSRQRNVHPGFPYIGRLDAQGRECAPAQVLAYQCSGATGFRDPNPRPGVIYTETTPAELIDNADVYGGSAELEWKLGEVTLTSLSAYHTVDRDLADDLDASDRGIGNFGNFNYTEFWSVRARQFTQELRLAGGDDRLKWIAGLFYFNDRRDAEMAIQQLTSATSPFDTNARVSTNSYAAFGQVDYALSGQVSVTGGVRFTRDEKRINVVTCDQFSGCPAFNRASFVSNGSNVSGRLGVEWRPTSKVLVYANATSGYKSGEFNVVFLGGAAASAAPVGAENTYNFELGTKAGLFNGAAQLNVSLFHTTTKDKQAVATTALVGSTLLNIGDLESYGAEIEFSAKPISPLDLQLGIGLLKTEINAPPSVTISRNFGRQPLPLDGNTFLNSPEFSVNGLARLNLGEGPSGRFDFQTDFRWQTKVFIDIANSPYDVQPSYGVVNLRALWRSPDKRFRAQIFVENLGDASWFARGASIGGLDFRFSVWGSKPRTFGGLIGIDF